MNEQEFPQGSVPVAVAARVYGKDASWVRAGIVSGWLPIGKATRSGKLVTTIDEMDSRYGRINFYISPKRLYLDITAPLYWWKEFDTYKVGTVANSCSTMHKIAEKEFTLENFSCEHLLSYWGEEKVNPTIIYPCTPMQHLNQTIACLNVCRKKYLETKDKKYWWQMIQLLPSSYNQRRTVMLNYEVLANIYKSRRNHKLDEWHTFCDWIEGLPYSALITGTAV